MVVTLGVVLLIGYYLCPSVAKILPSTPHVDHLLGDLLLPLLEDCMVVVKYKLVEATGAGVGEAIVLELWQDGV